MMQLQFSKEKKEILIFSINRLITILGLVYLVCIPLGKIQKDNKLEPEDFGVAMILLVANSDMVERIKKINKDGVEFEEKVIAAAEQKAISIIDQRENIDRDAMRYVDLQLSETASTDITPESLHEKISKVSPTIAECIYSRAKDVRHKAWVGHEKGDLKNGLMERTVPIFKALVDSEHGKECHRFYAQLGYALKDQSKPKWKEAEANLGKAIKLWEEQNSQNSLPPFYCFNWVICVAELDRRHNFQREYTWQDKEEIIKRIQAAKECETLFDALQKNEAYQEWQKHNSDWLGSEPESCPKNYCRKEQEIREYARR